MNAKLVKFFLHRSINSTCRKFTYRVTRITYDRISKPNISDCQTLKKSSLVLRRFQIWSQSSSSLHQPWHFSKQFSSTPFVLDPSKQVPFSKHIEHNDVEKQMSLFRCNLRFQPCINLIGCGGIRGQGSQNSSRRQGCSGVGGERVGEELSSRFTLVVDSSDLSGGSRRDGFRRGKSADIGGCHEGDKRRAQNRSLHGCQLYFKW